MKVKLVDLTKQYGGNNYMHLMDIIKTGQFVGSSSFEKKFAAYHGVEHCVGVGSGTDALLLSLLALGIGPGDEVIVPANTFIATAFAVSHIGATPVFCDVDPWGYVLTKANVEEVLTDKTKAVIPVHLYGQPAHVESLKGLGLYIIEDCAQAAGAEVLGQKVGTHGHIGCFSFYPTKNLGGLGQGGAIITDDEKLATTISQYGNVGRKQDSWDNYSYIGFNSRLDAINAAFLEVNLRYLDQWNNKRIAIANQYEEELSPLVEVFTPPAPVGQGETVKPVYHLYEIQLDSKRTRTYLMKHLNKNGIEARLHNSVPCHLQPMYKDMKAKCPNTEKLANVLMSLPMHPYLTKEEVTYVCDNIKEWFGRRKK